MRLRAIIVLLFTSLCWSQDSPKLSLTSSYWSAVAVTGIGIAIDGYTTVASIHSPRPNQSVCTHESGLPELYGKHPQVARVSLVMAGEFAGATILSYELKRHLKGRIFSKLWLAPLSEEAGGHWRGAIHNFTYCP